MAISIIVGEVEQVLLADGWHHVRDSSFEVDAYEFRQGDKIVLTDGPSDRPPMGAMWMEPDGSILACPLTAVLGVKKGTGEGYPRPGEGGRS